MVKLERINFYVVDIETTGANSRSDRITDLAVIKVKSGEIVDSFTSLVNPRQPIPKFIQSMTGITDGMVRNAPDEMEVLEKYIKFIDTENAVFVAHNANFDYYFIRNALMRTFGKPIDQHVLCTVKLARKILPKTQKVNLTALTKYYHIPVFMRHRALGDAFATARALIRMLEVLKLEHGIETLEQLKDFKRKSRKRLKFNSYEKENLLEKLDSVPDCQGIFHLLNNMGEIIYSDKADNLRDKLYSFFDPYSLSSIKMKRILEETANFEYEDTPSTLHSELKLGDIYVEQTPLELFEESVIQESIEDVIYIDTNNSRGKTVSIFLFKDGLLADHLEIGKNANTNILETIIEDIYYNESNDNRSSDKNEERALVRRWLSKEPDLGNKFQVIGDKAKFLRDIKNFVRSCY